VSSATVADLRRIDLFDELDDEQLARWAAVTELSEAQEGAILAEAGEPSPGLQLLLEGSAQALLNTGGHIEPVGRHQSPTWIGAVASLTARPVAVRMQAETTCRVATIPSERFEQLVLAYPTVHRRVIRQIAPVVSRITSIEQNRNRLASLGTMSAGLAHELNNPASAAKRATDELGEALEVLGATIGRFVEAGVDHEHAERLVELQRQALAGAAERTQLDALDAADAEDELLARLEQLGVEEAWRLAEPLASAGVDEAWLASMADQAGAATPAAIAWVGTTLTARSLVTELRESVQRIADLVSAVKAYAYLDHGELVEVDIHEGLETTLKVLGHKLKHTEIEVVRDYDRTLPQVFVRGSELNQVWTNLIANAIEALRERGTITIRTRRDGPSVLVEVSDDGPGIPAEALTHVFDPFFTTKEVGQGTGLGLDVARRIVVDRHDGSLTVDSEPGATTFRVRLPLGPPKQAKK
jgi:signal transduction histidine kinase